LKENAPLIVRHARQRNGASQRSRSWPSACGREQPATGDRFRPVAVLRCALTSGGCAAVGVSEVRTLNFRSQPHSGHARTSHASDRTAGLKVLPTFPVRQHAETTRTSAARGRQLELSIHQRHRRPRTRRPEAAGRIRTWAPKEAPQQWAHTGRRHKGPLRRQVQGLQAAGPGPSPEPCRGRLNVLCSDWVVM